MTRVSCIMDFPLKHSGGSDPLFSFSATHLFTFIEAVHEAREVASSVNQVFRMTRTRGRAQSTSIKKHLF